MKFIDKEKDEHPFADPEVLAKFVQDTKEQQITFRNWILEDPRRGITKDFIEEMKEARNEDEFWNTSASMRLAIKIPVSVYHAAPEFWQEQLDNQKKFKSKYPYFCV